MSQKIPALLGDSQAQSPFILSQAYSPGGSINLYIDKLGQIRTIDGYTRQNAAAFTTDTGGSAAFVRSLYQFRKIAAGATTRQVLMLLDDGVNEAELHYSTDLGVTKTLITDFGAGSVGTILDFAMFGDQLIITNGVITPRIWDGAALTVAGGTQLAAPTLAASGSGPLDGAYKYRVIPILANKQRKIASVASASFQISRGAIALAWTADADGTVVGYEIWRTSGTGLDYYFLAYSDGRLVVAYVDNLPDIDLLGREALAVVASHGDAPPVGAYFCVAHKGRMWYLRTDTYPRRLWHSDPGNAASVYLDRSYSELTDAASLGDVIVGGAGDFDGMIVIFLENSIWTISGTGEVVGQRLDWRKRRANAAKTGSVSGRTVVRVPAGSVYLNQEGEPVPVDRNVLAYMTPQKDIRIFDGTNDRIISYAKTDTLARLNLTHARKSFAYDDLEHQMFVWVFPADNDTEPSLSVAWNYAFGTFHEWTGTNFGHVTPAESSSARILLAGDARVATGALLYRLWNGTDQDGADIIATFLSKPLYPPIEENGLPEYSYEKRLANLFLLFAKDATPTSLTVGILSHDAADADAPIISRVINGTSRVKVPGRYPAANARAGKYFTGPGWRIKLTSTADTGPWTLRAIDQMYQVLPGATR